MTLLNKTGVAVKVAVVGVLLALVACVSENRQSMYDAGGAYFKRLPPCNSVGEVKGRSPQYFNCEIERTFYALGPLGSKETRTVEHKEYGSNGIINGLDLLRWSVPQTMRQQSKYGISIRCWENGKSKAYYDETKPDSKYNTASSRNEVEQICELIRLVAEQQASNARASVSPASPEQRLEACDSFGFERGTEAHAECAMKLYMNEQSQGTVKAATSSNNQQTAALTRQQAIQEATIKEQKRIQELEASLRMMQFGIDLMNGTTSSPTPSKTHSQTYNINGQIIRCTTTDSITTCL